MSVQAKYDAVMDALNRLFNDKSVSQTETKSMLKDVREEVEVMMDALKSDDE